MDNSQTSGFMPTNIEQVMHTMSLNDPNYYVDTWATSHMTNSQGNLSPYFNLSNHINNTLLLVMVAKFQLRVTVINRLTKTHFNSKMYYMSQI